MKLWSVALLLVLPLMAVAWVLGVILPYQAGHVHSSQVPPDWSSQDAAVKQAVQQAISGNQKVVAFQLYQFDVRFIQYTATGDWALVYMAQVDPQTGLTIPTEPVMFIARLGDKNQGLNAAAWHISMPSDPDWGTTLAQLPADLQTPEVKDFLVQPVIPQTLLQYPLGGYYLPWAKGQTKYLSQGANHGTCIQPTDCLYAFDFYDYQNPPNHLNKFPLLAAKGGSVYAERWDCADRPETETIPGDCTNFITLKDISTTPTSYQIYLHMSYNTIPAGLRTVGAPVQQGQFLGNADNTGASYGSHVHFMVVTSPIMGSHGYTWGVSVDVTFKDVFINWDSTSQGGRPCLITDVGYGHCIQYSSSYTSGNQGANPPIGDLILPEDKTFIQGNTVLVGGYGLDDLGVTRLSMLANTDGSWREVGPLQSVTPFAFDLDLCNAGIPDGPFDLALRVWDVEGNQSWPQGVRHLVKDGHCPPPPPPTPGCQSITSGQVAIYALPDYLGACQIFGTGSFTNLSPVGDNAVASIRVGADVQATLYDGISFNQRRETLTWDVHNLAGNRIGSGIASAIKVQARSQTPPAPTLSAELGPLSTAPNAVDSLIFSWTGDSATKYQARLFQGSFADLGSCASGIPIVAQSLQPGTTFPIGTLAAGTYTWCVQGRVTESNLTPHYSPWALHTFTVGAGTLPAVSAVLPFSDAMESGSGNWTASGFWRLAADPANPANHLWVSNVANSSGIPDYANAAKRSGDLTSPTFAVPASGAYYLRFDYRTQTEASTSFWDQRWVQISVNGGPFQNVAQYSDDAMNQALHSQPISLASYSGENIRVRFHFDVIDQYYNGVLAGWFIDNVAINTTQPPTCSESPTVKTLANPAVVLYGVDVSGMICPEGNADYYKISSSSVHAGDYLLLDLDALSLPTPSSLNGSLSLYLDTDLTSVLAENAVAPIGAKSDPYLEYYIKTAGNYIIRVKAQDSPGAGGPNANYVLHVRGGTTPPGDSIDPLVTLNNPAAGQALPGALVVLTATATDEAGGSGMNRVEFWWHSSDWATSSWTLIGKDFNGADGWSMPFDTTGLPEDMPIAIFAAGYDQFGNVGISANMVVPIDLTLYPLYLPQVSN